MHESHRQPLLPRLGYSDAEAAIEFLSTTFGFEEVGRFPPQGEIAYAELSFAGKVVISISTAHQEARSPLTLGGSNLELFLDVDDVDAHWRRAKEAGAEILSRPEDQFWGERTYAARDPEGYRWIFRQSIEAPKEKSSTHA